MVPDLTISAVGLRMVKLLVGTEPQTITDLVRAIGVTRTAVAEQLNDLEAAGLVQRDTERLPGRGRPHYIYSATSSALVLLFASNQRLVVPAIWRAIEELAGAEMSKRILSRVSGFLADHYNAKIRATDPKERLKQFVDLLREEGGLLELQNENGHVALYKRSCPFISMADENRNICCVDLDMISNVVGAPVRQVTCRQDGSPCCVFELQNGAS
jgi:predicted ArsR family transcriptional regulator